jgi:hypothetical protein
MTDWIDQKAAQDKATKEEAERRLAVARETVDQLEAIVRTNVEKWNISFRRQKIDGVSKAMPSGAFTVRKTSFPSATANAFLSPDSSMIEIETVRRRPVGDGSYSVKKEFYLKLKANGGIALTTHLGEPITLEEVSRVLLETIVEGSATPSPIKT